MVNNLYILAQKQGKCRDHVNHTRKIAHDCQQKIFFHLWNIKEGYINMNLEDPRQMPKEIRKKTQKTTLGLHHSKSFFFLFTSLFFPLFYLSCPSWQPLILNKRKENRQPFTFPFSHHLPWPTPNGQPNSKKTQKLPNLLFFLFG